MTIIVKTVRRKSRRLIKFISEMHDFIVGHPQFRQRVDHLSEVDVQRELRPIIVRYLENYFQKMGHRDPVNEAHRNFYWEGQEGRLNEPRPQWFGGRSYPDFIIMKPYLIAIEFKKGESASILKNGIGQAIVHTMSSEYDYSFLLFKDSSRNRHIVKEAGGGKEAAALARLQKEFNAFISVV